MAPNTNYLTYATIKNGSKGNDVRFAQRFFGIYLGTTSISQDGIFGSTTETYAKQFQKSCGLTQDGIIGTNSWNYLAPTLSPSYSKWNKDKAVKYIQTALKSVGRYTGAIDGDYGVGTENAVKAMQKAYGITVDGKWGKQCWNLDAQGYY